MPKARKWVVSVPAKDCRYFLEDGTALVVEYVEVAARATYEGGTITLTTEDR